MSKKRKSRVVSTPAPTSAGSVHRPLPPYALPGFWVRVLVVTQLLFLAAEFSPDLSTNGDDARYYLLGKSLLAGNGYRDLYDPANAIHTQYPPLFPALLGIADAVTHSPLLPKLLIGLLSAGILLLLWRYTRQRFAVIALALALFTALSSSIAGHATLLMSEIPFLFATLAALMLYECSRKIPGMGVLFWAATLVSLCPVFIRSAGLAFSAAWVLCALFDKRYKLAAAHGLLFIGITLLLRLSTEWDSPYVDQLFRKNQYDPELGFVTAAEMAARIGQNVRLYLFSITPHAVLGIPLSKNSALTASIAILIPAAIGWIRNFMLPTRFISIYLLLYAGTIGMWQVQWSSVRFLIPVLPFIALFLFLGVQTIVEFFARRCNIALPPQRLAGIAIAVALLLSIANVTEHLRQIKTGSSLTQDWKNFYSCADWIRLNTPSDAIVVNRKPELFYLRAQRKGFVYPFSHDVEKVVAGLEQGGARYCVLDNFSWTNTSARYLFPAIMSHPERFKVVYSLRNPDTYILEFRTP
jgi:hypothetical protein